MRGVADEARFWDRIARKYAKDPIADPGGYERTLTRLGALLAPDQTVLEIGCGTGMTALRLMPHTARYRATDVSSEMIAIARERAAVAGVTDIVFETGRPDTDPAPDASLDAVLGFNVLHLLRERAAALANIHRMLKPGGLFISKTPCIAEMNPLVRLAIPVARALGKAPYVSIFAAEGLEREIVSAGFTIVGRERHGTRRRDPRIFLVTRRD